MRAPRSGRRIGGSCSLRVVLIDDDQAFLRVLQPLVLAAGLICVGVFLDPEAALIRIPDIEPDVALIDDDISKMPGIRCIRLLRSKMPDLRIIALSEHANASAVEQAFAAGATGYLVKRECQDGLPEAIRAASKGTLVLSPSIGTGLKHDANLPTSDNWDNLTPQQQQIVRFLRLGHSDKMIADQMGLAVRTVNWHLESIYRRVGANSRLELLTRLLSAQQKKSSTFDG